MENGSLPDADDFTGKSGISKGTQIRLSADPELN